LFLQIYVTIVSIVANWVEIILSWKKEFW